MEEKQTMTFNTDRLLSVPVRAENEGGCVSTPPATSLLTYMELLNYAGGAQGPGLPLL